MSRTSRTIRTSDNTIATIDDTLCVVQTPKGKFEVLMKSPVAGWLVMGTHKDKGKALDLFEDYKAKYLKSKEKAEAPKPQTEAKERGMSQMSKKELEAALEEMQQKVAAQQDTIEKLSKSRRPPDAIVIGTNLTFQKGTHQELLGKKLKLRVPSEAITLHISSVCKKNKNGNVYCWATGWIDTNQLDLTTATEVEDDATKASKSAKDTLGL